MIEAVQTEVAFSLVRPEWEALYQASGISNPFLTWSWLANWIRHLAPRFVALLHRTRPTAPVDAAMVLGFSGGKLLWDEDHSSRSAILHLQGQPPPLRAFLVHLARHHWRGSEGITLNRVENPQAFRQDLDTALGALRFLYFDTETTMSRVVATEAAFDAYLAGRSSKVRQELRRKERAAARTLPGLELVELPLGEGAEPAMAIVEAVENDSWKVRQNTAIVSSNAERRFYAGVLGFDEPRTRARMFVLRATGGPVAFVLGLQHDRVFYALKTSYRLDHEALAPGQVLFFRVIERLCADPETDGLELLGNDCRWKRELATSAREEASFELVRPGPLGLARAVIEGQLAPLARQTVARHPDLARRLEPLRKASQRFRQRLHNGIG